MACAKFLDMIASTSILLLLTWVKSSNAVRLDNLSIKKLDEDTIGNKSKKVNEIGLNDGKCLKRIKHCP